MLDVHPPHAATHASKDFPIHVGTICVGLLIAVGLEQSVELVHRSLERREPTHTWRHFNGRLSRDDKTAATKPER